MVKRELALECDYRWEFKGQGRFKALCEADPQLCNKVGSGLEGHGLRSQVHRKRGPIMNRHGSQGWVVTTWVVCLPVKSLES